MTIFNPDKDVTFDVNGHKVTVKVYISNLHDKTIDTAYFLCKSSTVPEIVKKTIQIMVEYDEVSCKIGNYIIDQCE